MTKGKIIQKKREMEIYNGPTTLSLSMGNTFKKSLVVEKDHSSKRINLRFQNELDQPRIGLRPSHFELYSDGLRAVRSSDGQFLYPTFPTNRDSSTFSLK